jgi:hypothetical protein
MPLTPPLTPEWATFFSAELAALAALIGFIVVAISINLREILRYPDLPSRAFEALIAPVGAITATGFVLIPGQPPALLGAEVLAIGVLTVVTPIVILCVYFKVWTKEADVTPAKVIGRALTSEVVGVPIAVGGAILMFGASEGLYWIAVGDIACLIAIVFSAWVLMIEIRR